MAETMTLDYASGPQPEKFNLGLWLRLSVMMFLQYAIWGVWAPILGLHLGGLPDFQIQGAEAGTTTTDFFKIGLIYMTMPISSIIGPFIAGQIADRYFAAQRFLALSQMLGGVILLVVARLTSFPGIFVGMLLYNLIYAPTVAISNSIAFQHWPNKRFGWVRVWGSIGWIVIGLVFGLLWMEKIGPHFGKPAMVHCLYFAAGLSFLYGLVALVLPHTPPSKQPGGNPLAFLEAVRMMRVPAFAVMAVVAFLAAIELQLYFVWSQTFLEKGLGLAQSRVGPALTAGQICEMVMMVALPLALRKLGFRLTMALGIAAWAVRDFVFSIGHPAPLVLGAVSLHGIGYAFFFTVIFMFTDVVAPKDIKSSAQSFLASLTFGCGMLVGSLLAGPISETCHREWNKMFLVPAVLCTACCLVFLVSFRPKVETSRA